MMIECTKDNNDLLMAFLNQEPINNTFFISDIEHYGYESSFQRAYIGLDSQGRCCFACLRFHNLLILAGGPDQLSTIDIDGLIDDSVDVIMGKENLINQLCIGYQDTYTHNKKIIYKLVNDRSLYNAPFKAETATIEDAMDIHEFLNSIAEFRGLYASETMISNRIKGNEGFHIILRDDTGMIIAHGNTAASTHGSCFIGGIATHPEHRGKGLASAIISQLSREALRQGRYPCLLSPIDENPTIFENMGFRPHGKWGTLNRK